MTVSRSAMLELKTKGKIRSAGPETDLDLVSPVCGPQTDSIIIIKF